MYLLTTTQALVDSLVEIAEDYRNCNFNGKHVKKWLNQFPEEYHEVILTELNSVLSKTYFSESRVVEILIEFIEDKKIFVKPIKEYKFLNPQTQGNSQNQMLGLLDKLLIEQLDIQLNECGNGNVKSYIYLDDVMYTGNRVHRDIESWIATIKDVSTIESLDIIFLAIHIRNLEYVKSKLSELLPNTTINIWVKEEFKDDIKSTFLYEAYLPLDNQDYNENAIKYIEKVDEYRTEAQRRHIPLLRRNTNFNNDKYFTNSTNRSLVEKLFFEKGVDITSYAVNPNPNIRPMGYDFKPTLGFGSFIVTYRNTANNCPVVLWWGDLNASSGINNWYPLFPRTAN